MKSHDCIVGLYWEADGSELVTLDLLKEKIKGNEEFVEWCKKNGITGFRARAFCLSDYADGRKSTDLTRFDFCPICGKKIDWKKIKKMEESE